MGEYQNKWCTASGPDVDGEVEIVTNKNNDNDIIWITKADLEAILALFGKD